MAGVFQQGCTSRDAKAAQQETAIHRSLGKIHNKILVMSGKGGVGKSTVAVNLALGLANRGYQVGLMDVDLHGPDICRMLHLTGTLSAVRTASGLIPPMTCGSNLKIISLEYMLENKDDPIIWRGPLKMQAIRQFVGEIDWGRLDYLIIDAPPGTGDEPLTVATTIKDAKALIVTTPQDVSLADVRKSINFCRHVNIQILGLLENMSGLLCPHCNQQIELFKRGGGRETAEEFSLPFLGQIPLDPQIVIAGDIGTPFLVSDQINPAVQAFAGVIDAVERRQPAVTRLAVKMAGCGCDGGCSPA